MKNYLKKIIIVSIAVVIAVAAVIFSNDIKQLVFKESGNPQNNVSREVTLVINDGEGNPETFTAEFKEKMTAFDLLKSKTETSNMVLKFKSYDMGVFVEAIGNKENGQDGKYWLYYVNGEMPQVAADKRELSPGDKVEFNFEKSPF